MSGVADATPYRSNYVGNGSTVSFPYNFKIANAADLEVIEAGVTLTLNTDYSVTGVGVDAGGTVVRTVAPINGAIGSILRKQPLNMLSVYTPNEDFPSVRVANDLEKLTMEVQFLAEKIARSLKFKKASILSEQDVDDPTVGLFARAKVGGGIDWASVVTAGAVSIPVSIAQGGSGGTTVATARTNYLLSSQVTIAAAAALPVTQDSYQVVTGNTGITSLATQPVGTVVVLRFTGTPLITHNGASLILLGAVNYQVAVGDMMEVVSEGAGNWRETWRRPVTNAVSGAAYLGNGTWGVPALRGYLYGLTFSNNAGDAVNDIDVTAGECSSDDATVALRQLITPGALTKQLDVAWAVGTNAGMRDTGAIADGTWHIFAIKRSDTGVSDILASLSPTAPTMPTNYDKKSYVFSILREAGSIVGFVQVGRYVRRKASVLSIAATNPGTAAVLAALHVPTGLRLQAIMNSFPTFATSTNGILQISDPLANDEAPSINVAPLGVSGAVAAADAYGDAGRITEFVNTSAQIRYRLSASGAADVVRIATLGWWLPERM